MAFLLNLLIDAYFSSVLKSEQDVLRQTGTNVFARNIGDAIGLALLSWLITALTLPPLAFLMVFWGAN